MKITEVRIKLVENNKDRLKAFCSITFDNCFVIRDLKVIEGTNGVFVAMPSRKLTDRCSSCRAKNHLRARHCNECGARLGESRADSRGRRLKLHADIAHPINSDCRQMIQKEIQKAYDLEYEKSQQPGYVPSFLDFDDDYSEAEHYAESSGANEDHA
ncbi:MAG: septation protein SpoVG family protein [Phycisphaerae bacterium]|nr:septation protein SpoVG family protein [Phycisphaerae bacterium]